MKRLAIAALLTISTAAHAEFLTGNTLLEKMNGDAADRYHAYGYIMGVSDAISKVTMCAPADVTVGQMYDMIYVALKNHPTHRNLTADMIVRAVLEPAFPCPQKQAKREVM